MSAAANTLASLAIPIIALLPVAMLAVVLVLARSALRGVRVYRELRDSRVTAR